MVVTHYIYGRPATVSGAGCLYLNAQAFTKATGIEPANASLPYGSETT